ncbi:MAG: Flp pilus assembly complex ATPase component TadA [Treponema sp.]|nr:Flp pilus assembly complex ATPase component TadA [Treponema sp.]
MKDYEFKLNAGYCLYNGIAVMSQSGASICFMAENPKDELLKERVKKAFNNYLAYMLRRPDCPPEYKKAPSVQFIKGNRAELRKCVSQIYTRTGDGKEDKMSFAEKNLEPDLFYNDAAAVLLLDTLMNEARNRKATDIHIENNTVKFRICGKLEAMEKLSEDKCSELVQRIKFLAGMNVLEKRRSQDGHFVYGNEDPVFVRVSSVGILGKNGNETQESVVIRLLDTKRLPLALDGLGFNESQLEVIQKMNRHKNGLILICGPTGAGKSTTAAAVLMDIEKNSENKLKIISMEDPPEYLIPGVTQIQVDEKVNASFADSLMHIFRQDPDVLMIGEIRDEGSAAVAIRAALTGHLVIATLHTASAAGAIFRLEDLGVPRNLIVSILRGVIVQELNYFKGNVSLVADAATPMKELERCTEKMMTEDKLEALFLHCTNYADLFHKTIEILKSRQPVVQLPKKAKPAFLVRKGRTKASGSKAGGAG